MMTGEAMTAEDSPAGADASPGLRESLHLFQSPALADSLGQVATSFLPFLGLWAMMYASLDVGYWLTLMLAVPAAAFVVRIFIIQHDCGHGAFFRSHFGNDTVGRLCSLVTFTPYASWRRQHADHHANWNNLDRRASGVDIYSTCMTVEEYARLTPRQRRIQRLIHHPFIKLGLLPPFVFVVLYRLPFDTPKNRRKQRHSVHLTNLSLALLYLTLAAGLGWRAVLLVELPIITLAAIAGVWLFSIQHRFETSRWMRQDEWTACDASLRGSSYLRLPGVLRWFSGNIGFHHIHHLNPRIPNYRLRECQERVPILHTAPTLTLRQALQAWRYCLYDEAGKRMVPFPERQ